MKSSPVLIQAFGHTRWIHCWRSFCTIKTGILCRYTTHCRLLFHNLDSCTESFGDDLASYWNSSISCCLFVCGERWKIDVFIAFFIVHFQWIAKIKWYSNATPCERMWHQCDGYFTGDCNSVENRSLAIMGLYKCCSSSDSTERLTNSACCETYVVWNDTA